MMRQILTYAGVLMMAPALSHAQPCAGDLDQFELEDGPFVTRTFFKRVRVIDGTAWAVGYQQTIDELLNIVMRLEGDEWVEVQSPSPENVLGQAENTLFDLDGRSGDDIWAVGGYTNQVANSNDTLALYWDGSEWEHIITPGQSGFGASGFQFEAVHVTDDGTVWFGGQAVSCVRGEGFLVSTDGSGGFDAHCVGIPTNAVARYRDIDSSSADDVWAVGARGGVAVAVGRAIAAHFDGSSWQPNNPPQTGFGEILYAVSVISPDDVWASGVYDEVVDGQVVSFPLFWHWDGASWTRFESPGFAVDLHAFSSDNIYGVSGRRIVHWDGDQWSLLPQEFDPGSASSINMVGIAAFDACDLVFAGHKLALWRGILARLQGSQCVADITGDGVLDFFDVSAFLKAFNASDPVADFTGDGTLDFFDVSSFLNAYNAGCP